MHEDTETITVAETTDGTGSPPDTPAGEPVTLPVVDLLTGRGFVTGKSGSGKSNTASILVENLLDGNFPVLIVDTDGEYYGLKEEYEILHVGAGGECDIQVSPEHAEKLAELALVKGVPIILDVSGYLDDDVADTLVRETARHLYVREQTEQQPFLMLVEECHEYIPEAGGLDETGRTLIRVAKRGRKRGLGIVGISQRPADVKKDFITQCDWLCWHRLTWDNDKKVVGRNLGGEYRDGVEGLADGEAFLVADWAKSVRRVQFHRKRTFDAGATPGLDDFERPDLKSVSGDLVSELKEISDEHERRQDELARKNERINELETQVAELQAELEDARDFDAWADSMVDAMQDAAGDRAADVSEEVIEKAVAERVDSVQSKREEELVAERDRLRERVDVLSEERDELESKLEDAREELENRPEITEREREAAAVLAESFGVSDDRVEQLEHQLQQERELSAELEETVSRLRESQGSTGLPDLDDDPYLTFYNHEIVQDKIETALDAGKPRYVKGIVELIAERGEAVTRGEVADDLGIKQHTHVKAAADELESVGVVTTEGSGRDQVIDFRVENLEQLRERAARRERIEG